MDEIKMGRKIRQVYFRIPKPLFVQYYVTASGGPGRLLSRWILKTFATTGEGELPNSSSARRIDVQFRLPQRFLAVMKTGGRSSAFPIFPPRASQQLDLLLLDRVQFESA
jgi:hypothetical protein